MGLTLLMHSSQQISYNNHSHRAPLLSLAATYLVAHIRTASSLPRYCPFLRTSRVYHSKHSLTYNMHSSHINPKVSKMQNNTIFLPPLTSHSYFISSPSRALPSASRATPQRPPHHDHIILPSLLPILTYFTLAPFKTSCTHPCTHHTYIPK